jgi:hypothetical protein
VRFEEGARGVLYRAERGAEGARLRRWAAALWWPPLMVVRLGGRPFREKEEEGEGLGGAGWVHGALDGRGGGAGRPGAPGGSGAPRPWERRAAGGRLGVTLTGGSRSSMIG